MTDVSALIARADADFSTFRMTEAATAYRQVLAALPHNAHALHRMGLVCAHMNQLVEAVAYVDLAIHAAPACAGLWEHAGLIAAMKGENIRAEALYHRALGLAGSTATLHRNLADCLRQSRRLVEAKEQYEHAIAIQPDLHHAIRAVARISTELNDIEHAADYWIRAWALDSSALQDGLDLIAALANAKRTAQLDAAVIEVKTLHGANAEALEALCLS